MTKQERIKLAEELLACKPKQLTNSKAIEYVLSVLAWERSVQAVAKMMPNRQRRSGHIDRKEFLRLAGVA